MCTAATYQTKDFYMGRTLDYEFSYGEQIAFILTPNLYCPIFSLLSSFFNDTAPTAIYTLSLHDALPICRAATVCD